MAYTLNPSIDFFNIAGDVLSTGEATWTVKVDSGAAQHIGTASTKLDNIAPGLGEPNSLSVIVTGVGAGHDLIRSVTAGTNTGKLDKGYYTIIRGGAYSEHIHGDAAFTKLRSAGFKVRDSIHRRFVVRGPLTATAIRNGQWNSVSGSWSADPTASTAGLWNNVGNASDTTGGADQAALPSGAIPGELVYKEPQANPVQDDYKARYLW